MMKPTAPSGSTKFARYAAASAAALGAAAAADAQFTGSYGLEVPSANTFNDPADLSTFGQWTFDLTSAGGNAIVTTSSGASLVLTASTGSIYTQSFFNFTAVAAETGNVSFDYSSVFTDPGGAGAGFRYMINGTPTFVDYTTSSGTVSFAVNSGDVFGFRVSTAYVYSASMAVTITNFSAPIPEASTSTLLAGVASLGFVGLVARRRVRARQAAS